MKSMSDGKQTATNMTAEGPYIREDQGTDRTTESFHSHYWERRTKEWIRNILEILYRGKLYDLYFDLVPGRSVELQNIKYGIHKGAMGRNHQHQLFYSIGFPGNKMVKEIVRDF